MQSEQKITNGHLPLIFAPNAGQLHESVRFSGQGNDFRCQFMQDRMALTIYRTDPDWKNTRMNGVTISWKFVGSSSQTIIEGVDGEPGVFHYMRGKDPKNWCLNVPIYRKIAYRQLWHGIDALFYSEENRLKYDFIVHPGAEADDIRFVCEGAENIRLDSDGNLIMETRFGTLTDLKPYAYQIFSGEKKEVECHYQLSSDSEGVHYIGFEVTGQFDWDQPLIIDPILLYSSYLGGSDNDQARAVAVDAEGHAYVTGFTQSADFPTTAGVFDRVLSGVIDVFVTKMNASGTGLIYSTFLGGSGDDFGQGIAVDNSGNVYITGETESMDFPTTVGAFSRSFNGTSDAFVAKLNSSGSGLIYSTYLGGADADRGLGIDIDSQGNAYVTGETLSNNFPVTVGAFDQSFNGGSDGFVTKLNASGAILSYSTYLGGAGSDRCSRVVVDVGGNAYVTGETNSLNFPTTPGVVGPNYGGGARDAFVTKFNPSGSTLVYSTYVGGNGIDRGFDLDIDADGNIYLTGDTGSINFPVTNGAFDRSFNGGTTDAFVSKLNAGGTAFVYSTYLGGSGTDVGNGIAVDGSGDAYVTGSTSSANFPIIIGAFDITFNGGATDAFITRVSVTGSDLLYSSYFGGSALDTGTDVAVDSFNNAYVSGFTLSPNIPVTPNAFQENLSGSFDAFVAKLGMVVMPGEKGTQGQQGDQGPRGRTGTRGMTGLKGPQGPSGTTDIIIRSSRSRKQNKKGRVCRDINRTRRKPLKMNREERVCKRYKRKICGEKLKTYNGGSKIWFNPKYNFFECKQFKNEAHLSSPYKRCIKL